MEAILPGTHKSHPSPRFWFRTIASRSQWSRLSRHHNSCLCLSCPHNQSLSQYHHRSGLQWRDARLQWGGQEAICQPWWIKAEQIQQPWSNLQVWIDNLTHHHKYMHVHCAGSSATVVSTLHSGSDHCFKDALRLITQFRLDSDRWDRPLF